MRAIDSGVSPGKSAGLTASVGGRPSWASVRLAFFVPSYAFTIRSSPPHALSMSASTVSGRAALQERAPLSCANLRPSVASVAQKATFIPTERKAFTRAFPKSDRPSATSMRISGNTTDSRCGIPCRGFGAHACGVGCEPSAAEVFHSAFEVIVSHILGLSWLPCAKLLFLSDCGKSGCCGLCRVGFCAFPGFAENSVALPGGGYQNHGMWYRYAGCAMEVGDFEYFCGLKRGVVFLWSPQNERKRRI